MRAILIFLLIPCWTIGQEFYPGSIYNIDSPICYNNTATLGFEANPYDENSNYSYQWQKSWDGANWFNIPNANSTIYTTDSLFIDTYYRAIVSSNNISIPTNQIVVYVLPELQPGLLSQPDSICVYDEFILDFEIGASGAEWNWGGFLEFSYQWQQNNLEGDSLLIDEENWMDVGGNWNIYCSSLPLGTYAFRCMISSSYGCGVKYTENAFLRVVDCVTNLKEEGNNISIIDEINLLGQQQLNSKFLIYIYSDGTVKKTCQLYK